MNTEEEILKKKLTELMEFYDYNLDKETFDLIIQLKGETRHGIYIDKLSEKAEYNEINAIEFIEFLNKNSCNNNITMSFVNKGITEKFVLSDNLTKFYLKLLANTIYYYKTTMEINPTVRQVNNKNIYNDEFTTGFKNKNIFIEPYTNEEIEVVKKETKLFNSKETKITPNMRIGLKCSYIESDLELTLNNKGTKTKLYSFIYDIIALYGETSKLDEGFKGDTGREKFQSVKNWIKANEDLENKVLKAFYNRIHKEIKNNEVI